MTYRRNHWTDPAGQRKADAGVSGDVSSMKLRLPPIRRGDVVAGVLIVCAVAAVSAWVAYPWTKNQCLHWAAERGSDSRARLALDICEQRFGELFKR